MSFENLVFFGSIKTAKNCLRIILKNLKFKKLLVVTETKKKYNFVKKYAKKKNLSYCSLKEFEKNINKKNKYDLGFSIRYNKIFKNKLINKFKFGIINLHGGDLPKYRGTSSHIFAIANQEKKFGCSLHFVNKKIDSGRILKVKYFKINKKESGYSLLNKGFKNGEILLNNFTKNLSKTKVFPKGRINQNNKGKNYTFEKLKILKTKFVLNDKNINLNLVKRALYHPEKKNYGL